MAREAATVRLYEISETERQLAELKAKRVRLATSAAAARRVDATILDKLFPGARLLFDGEVYEFTSPIRGPLRIVL